VRLWDGGLTVTEGKKLGATVKNCVLALAFLLTLGSQTSVCRSTNEPCDGSKIPPAISAILEKSFPHWRVERIADLDSEYQELWTKKYPNYCPGFVTGHFQKQDSLAYAALLVPADDTKKGYRLVVFSETTKDIWHSTLLEKDDQYTPTSAVIRLAPPGDYEEAENNKKVHTRTDGIVSERIETGVLVYFWNGARFRSITTSV
jgi:hypothetical protein